MNSRLVAVLALILMLLIGVFLGVLGGRLWWGPPRFEHGGPRGLRDGSGFAHRLERVLQPTAEQEDTVRQILEAHFDQFQELHLRQVEEATRLLDTLMRDLEGVLTEEQIARLREHVERQHPRQRRRGPGM